MQDNPAKITFLNIGMEGRGEGEEGQKDWEREGKEKMRERKQEKDKMMNGKKFRERAGCWVSTE